MIGKLLQTNGFDIGEYADLVKKGVIDPTKVAGCPRMTMPSGLFSVHAQLPRRRRFARRTKISVSHPFMLAFVHLNLKLTRLSWSTDRQPISFMSRSISARRFSSALSTPA